MKKVIALIAILTFAFSGIANAGKPVEEVRFISGPQEYNTGANRPWLDQTCYDDDHGLYFVARGMLNGTWTYTSPLPVCFDHHIKIFAQWKSRDDAVVSLIDYGGHSLPVRYSSDDSTRFFKGPVETAVTCNTDLGYLHYLQDDAPGLDEPRDYVTWTITTTKPTEIGIVGIIAEYPSPNAGGGEGSWDYCLFPPPGGLNPNNPFG